MLQFLFRVARQQYLGLLSLLLVIGGLADAASGGNFILGSLNTANSPSTLQNTKRGAALALKVQQGQPPLAVNSEVLVDNLNAALLNGHDGGDFAGADEVYTKAQSDQRYARRGQSLPRTIKIELGTAEIPGSAARVTAEAACPAGYRLISGGAFIEGTATAYLIESAGLNAGGKEIWRAVAINPPLIHFAGKLTAQIFCSEKGKPLVP